MPRQEGQFLVEDFFINTGGLNTADSPFVVDQSEATGGKNFDYIKRGGIQKRLGHAKLNSVADAQLRTQGLTLFDKPGTTRQVVRVAGTKLQVFDTTAYTFTNLSEDTAAATTSFLPGSDTTPVSGVMFNTATSGACWHIGGGLTSIYGAYSATKVTKNGAASPTGTIGLSRAGAGGTWTTGTYFYAISLVKASTLAESNATLDSSVSVTTATDTVTISFASLSAIDTTKYSKINVYRSVVSGVTGFTSGSLVKQVDITAGVPASTTDTGTVLLSSQNVPRANSTILDNSEFPAGPYNGIALFKRRLAVSKGSTVYLSDLNKPESCPTANALTIPSGGDITGMAVISLSSSISAEIDEALCIFKQGELWVITGNDVSDWALKFVDNSGAASQSMLVAANGYLLWAGHRGIFMWNGSGKPAYLSQCIEDKFGYGGDIDKSKLNIGFGVYVPKRHEVQWYLSSKTLGEQKYVLKLDLRLTLSATQDALGSRIVKGVFTPDVTAFGTYGAVSFFKASTSTEENLYLGDDAGFVYDAYTANSDGASATSLQYLTPYLTFGKPDVVKRIHKVVVWVLDTGQYDLNLDFWADYRYATSDATSLSQPISASNATTSFTWDVGKWDEVQWDTSSNKIRPVVFNIASIANNAEGDAIRLQLSQSGTSETVIIYGFSIYFTQSGVRK